MRVVVAGSTGLVGSLLTPLLLTQGHAVHTVQRRPVELSHPRLTSHVAAPEDWSALVAGIGAEAAVSVLGTTMKKAGSEAGFRLVDHDLVLDFAAAARAGGARRMLAVSSVGADPRSPNFYLRLKAEVERALAGLGFQRLDIVRPGLLRGQRGPDRRLGERIGIAVSPVVNLLLRGRLDRYAAIDAGVVAAGMAALLGRSEPGTHIHHNRELRRLAHL
jgi:uncharacterized protein YbjT (DUF2867 family)